MSQESTTELLVFEVSGYNFSVPLSVVDEVVPSNAIVASDPADKGMMFEPTASKIYRHPTFYEVPDEVGHM